LEQTSSDVTVLHDVPGFVCFGMWNDILFARWEQAADFAAVSRLQAINRDFRRAHSGRRLSGIHIVLEGAGLPTPEGRAGLADMMKKHADQFGAIAVVVGGTGFFGSAIRSFLTGLRILAPRDFDFRLHGKSSEILDWFPAAHQRRTGERVDVFQLGRVITSFEAAGNGELARRHD
jgi:hypothetical protein